jgi:hypothetical protein
VGDPFFVGQELIVVLAVSLKQVLAISDLNNHGVEFIRVDPGREPGNAIDFDYQLPILALRRRVNLEPKSVKGLFVAKTDDGDDAVEIGVRHGSAGCKHMPRLDKSSVSFKAHAEL